jgi:hypothetical protein
LLGVAYECGTAAVVSKRMEMQGEAVFAASNGPTFHGLPICHVNLFFSLQKGWHFLLLRKVAEF